MPVHWYYDRAALERDYGRVTEYVAPRSPHPDSILWRSNYTALNERGNILHDQAEHWGQKGVHYHQNLHAGENTLNLQLGRILLESLREVGGYDADDYLRRYVEFMLEPGRHRDTYVEECHRNFFTNYARGRPPRQCGEPDIHIGGLAHVGILCAWYSENPGAMRAAVLEHVELTHRDAGVLRAADSLCRVLCEVMQGKDLRVAIRDYASEYFSEKRSRSFQVKPDAAVVARHFSPACYIKDAFPATLYLAWKYADDFAAGIIANTNIGGDNCHRGAVLGALLGAQLGVGGILPSWVEGLRSYSLVRDLIVETPNPKSS
jgi:ADP-ribosylglycohydrolase